MKKDFLAGRAVQRKCSLMNSELPIAGGIQVGLNAVDQGYCRREGQELG